MLRGHKPLTRDRLSGRCRERWRRDRLAARALCRAWRELLARRKEG
jgi:hypothetical protein